MKQRFLLFVPISLLALCSVPLKATNIQFGFNGDALLGFGQLDFGQYPNGAPYTPAPGFGTVEISLVNAGVFSNNGLTTGEFGTIQSIFLQPGALTTFGPFLNFDSGANNLQLWATSLPAGTNGALSGADTPDGAVVWFDVDGYILDSNNPNYKQSFFSTFSLTFAGDTVAQVLQSVTDTPFTATVSLVAPTPLTPPATTTPEPTSALLLGFGLLGFGAARFRKRKK